MTKLKYQHLSAGYIGRSVTHMTINARYYSYLLNHPERLFQSTLLFPQRVPRSGFFSELSCLEGDTFQTTWSQQIDALQKRLKNLLDEKVGSEALNIMELLLRCGCCEEISKIDPDTCSFEDDACEISFQIIQSNADIEVDLSADLQVGAERLIKLARTALDNPTMLYKRFKMDILNRLIVLGGRLQAHMDKKLIEEATRHLYALMKEMRVENNRDALTLSFYYRGIAMSPFFNTQEKQDLLEEAENLAQEVVDNDDPITSLVAQENLYTLLLTLVKWELSQNRKERAIDILERMIELDPFDNTAFAEKGFILMKHENLDLAADYFYKAYELGPPGTAMHLYFYALCHYKLGNFSQAKSSFKQVADLDPESISPWLSLYEIEKEQKNMHCMYEIANTVLSKPLLREQLNEQELQMLTDGLNELCVSS